VVSIRTSWVESISLIFKGFGAALRNRFAFKPPFLLLDNFFCNCIPFFTGVTLPLFWHIVHRNSKKGSFTLAMASVICVI
jgi:hypothetical protein